MATDTPQQPAMEDILSSIRTGVKEETAKVGSGSADLIDAAAAQDGEEDVLELSADDMVAGAQDEDEADELIDISAFAENGQAKTVDSQTAADLAADILGETIEPAPIVEPVADVNIEGAADEFDRLLAEISQEQQQQVAAAHVTKQALMDEEEPLGTEAAAEDLIVEDEADVAVEEAAEESLEDAVVAESVAAFIPPVASGGKSIAVNAIEGADGVQLAFPAEVLAMALRPMVQDWLTKNLPSVVERLVKDEISKLTQN